MSTLSKVIGGAAVATSLLAASTTFAITVNLPGRSIDLDKTNTSSSAEINYNSGASTKASQTTTSGGTTVKTSVSSGSGTAGSVNSGSVQVRSTADLEAYKDAVIENCAAITSISTGSSNVEVNYNQSARLFGLFRSSLNAKVVVDEDGDVTVRLPWYGFLYSKNTASLKTTVEANLRSGTNAYSSISVGAERKAAAISLVSTAMTACGGTTTTKTSAKTNTTAEVKSKTTVETKTTSPTPESKTAPRPADTTPKPTTPTPTNVSFAGQWSGTYSANAVVSGECAAGGPTSMSISNSGSVTGYITVLGQQLPGTGSVDSSGNLTGNWHYAGATVTFSGKLNGSTNTGSGTYKDSYGCFGTFSLSR